MKRVTITTLAAFLCLCLIGCGETASVPVQQVQWTMTTVQSSENGAVLAVGSALMQESYPQARQMNLTCSFTDTAVTVQNSETGERWSGSYQLMNQGDQPTQMYDLSFADSVQGVAAIDVTKYDTGSKEPTLILSAGGYAVYFTAAQEE